MPIALRLLHQRLCVDLAEDGFDVERCSDIDFTRAFVCKSGDLISYLYRKANRYDIDNPEPVKLHYPRQ